MLKYLIGFCLLVSLGFVSAASDVGGSLLNEKKNNVVLLTPPSNPHTGGTGFEIKAPSGKVYTLTNRHICELAENYFLAARIGTVNARATLLRVVEIAPDTDLCLLEGLSYAQPFTMASGLNETEKLYALGHPFLEPLTESEGYIVSRDTVRFFDAGPREKCTYANQEWRQMQSMFGQQEGCVTSVDAYNTSIPIFPGNSGSPVLNHEGEVVGVAFASNTYTNFGSIIPFDVVSKFISIY